MAITWCDQYGPIGSVEWREMFMVTEYRMRGDHGNWEGGPRHGGGAVLVMEKYIIETPRLGLRRLTEADLDHLCLILQDAQAMYAYEHAFSDGEVREWLDKLLSRYEKYGFGLWAVELRESGEFVGQWRPDGAGDAGGPSGWRWAISSARDRWRRGYATEAAAACTEYAFSTLGAEEVCSIIRDNNRPSRAVAERNGFTAGERLHEATIMGWICRTSCM